MTEPTQADIRAACELVGLSRRAWFTCDGPLRTAVKEIARRIAAEEKAAPDARATAAEAENAKLREALETADYLINLHERILRREVVRDLAEAQGAYHRTRAALGETGHG